MRKRFFHLLTLFPLFSLFLISAFPANAQEAKKEEKSLHASVGIAAKYDSNLELTNKEVTGEDLKDSLGWEMTANLGLEKKFGQNWWLDADLFTIANWYLEREESWYFGKGSCYVGHSIGDHMVSVFDQIRYFVLSNETEANEFDFVRNTAIVAYQYALSPFWQLRTGYENLLTFYPGFSFYNYLVNGGFVELRNVWTLTFSTYVTYDFQVYQRDFTNAEHPDGDAGLGFKHTGKVGFEGFFLKKNVLIGTYTFQIDRSLSEGVSQVEAFEGEEESLDVEAEFNYLKHKGTLLYSHRFNDRLSLSFSEELIYKRFVEGEEDLLEWEFLRSDILVLSSIFLKVGLFEHWSAKAKYLFRMGESSVHANDFYDHLVYLGIQYGF